MYPKVGGRRRSRGNIRYDRVTLSAQISIAESWFLLGIWSEEKKSPLIFFWRHVRKIWREELVKEMGRWANYYYHHETVLVLPPPRIRTYDDYPLRWWMRKILETNGYLASNMHLYLDNSSSDKCTCQRRKSYSSAKREWEWEEGDDFVAHSALCKGGGDELFNLYNTGWYHVSQFLITIIPRQSSWVCT